MHKVAKTVGELSRFGLANRRAEHGVDGLYAALAGMFAEHDAVLAPDQPRIETLIVVGMLEQTIDVDSGLVRKHARADHALLPCHRTRRRVGDQFRERREAAQIDAGFNAIALA